jgi:hypothetical protein
LPLNSSCSSDDDSSSSQDPLIGTWKVFKYFENGVEVPLEPCESEETIVFSANGDLSFTDYIDNAGACEIDEATTGTWANVGSGSYSITIFGFTSTEDITFEGNTFYIEDIDDNGTPADPSDDIVYRDVYMKQ